MAALYYNTNGFAFHRLDDVLRILEEIGYAGVALTPDVHHLDPLRSRQEDVDAFRGLLADTGLGCVIETGARFVLDPKRKHRPNLLDAPPEAARRIAFLEACVDQAVTLGAPVVTLWSGGLPEDTSREFAYARLVEALQGLCAYAHARGVRIGFEPEPGMLVECVRDWPALRDAVDHPALGLSLDVGHCLAMREDPPEQAIRTHAADLLVLQLDDHRAGVHDHLAFGEGEVDFEAVAAAVREVGFEGPLEVELSRHSANAAETARRSHEFLSQRFR